MSQEDVRELRRPPQLEVISTVATIPTSVQWVPACVRLRKVNLTECYSIPNLHVSRVGAASNW